MTRNLLVTIVVIVVAAVAFLLNRDDDSASRGCDGVRDAAGVVDGVERGDAVPTSETYASSAQELRRAAVAAPGGVAADLHSLADAYGRLGILLQGFDPADPTTFPVIEEGAVDIEREEARVEEAADRVAAWLAGTCTT